MKLLLIATLAFSANCFANEASPAQEPASTADRTPVRTHIPYQAPSEASLTQEPASTASRADVKAQIKQRYKPFNDLYTGG